jgi:hypothetical protein
MGMDRPPHLPVFNIFNIKYIVRHEVCCCFERSSRIRLSSFLCMMRAAFLCPLMPSSEASGAALLCAWPFLRLLLAPGCTVCNAPGCLTHTVLAVLVFNTLYGNDYLLACACQYQSIHYTRPLLACHAVTASCCGTECHNWWALQQPCLAAACSGWWLVAAQQQATAARIVKFETVLNGVVLR